MSSFDIAVITYELNSIIKDARIDNIYQINPKTILLKLRSHNQPITLLIESGRRIHLISYDFEKPRKPASFCMALRKYLRNGWITNIHQHEFERIVILNVKRRDEEYQIISEFFGDGNIILIGPKGEILQALTYRRMRDRDILPKEKFVHAPPSGLNPTKLKREDLERLKRFDSLSVVKALTRLLSLGGLYAEETLLRAEVDKNTPCKSLTDDEMNRIFKHLNELLGEIAEGRFKPCIFIDDQGQWVDVTPIPLKRYEHLRCITYKSFNTALEEYYTRALTEKMVSEVERRAEQELKKLEIILQDQERTLKELEERAKLNRRIGDIIYRHIDQLQFLLQRLRDEKKSGMLWEEIAQRLQQEKKASNYPAVYFDFLLPSKQDIQVSVEGQTFQLNLKHSAQENASLYYEKAKKAERKMLGVKKAIEETMAKIEDLKKRMIEEAKEVGKMSLVTPRREWYEKFRWFHSSDGFLVIGGRDASTNEVLIKKYMEPNDIVFHTDIPGAPFVIVKTGGKTPPEQTIKEAAQLAVSYSRAWKEMLTTENVYWVSPEQVKKQPPSGQYLSTGSFMIYGKRNYVRNVPLEAAIGIKRKGDTIKVIGGPVDAIAKQTNLYVKIIPGKQTSSKLAKEIIRRLARNLPTPEREEVLRTPIEEVQKFIPLGTGDLSR